MKVQIRGARPLFVMTWAELSVLPRLGDTITIENDEEGCAYTVTDVQFDVRLRKTDGNERWLKEDGIVLHVSRA
jgi:hypothetical protein